VLSGYGAGTACISNKSFKKVIIFDIGIGTTNTCMFSSGEVEDSFVIDY
jgi:ethanolamine utilization protein EutA (predicted chaperonin)